MMDHKFTENPFSSRKSPAQNVNRTMTLSPRSPWLAPFAYTVALVACGLIATAFSSSLPNNPVVLTPLSSQADRQPFRPAGLRGQASLRLVQTNNEESPPKASAKPRSDEEDDIEEDFEADSDHDPQYIMPLRKFLGTRQQAAQREHHEIHDQVQDHIFGQNRSGSTVEIEEDPSVIIKDWDSDSEDAEDEVKAASEQATKDDKEAVESATTSKEEDTASKKKH